MTKLLTQSSFMIAGMIGFQIYGIELIILLSIMYVIFGLLDIATGYFGAPVEERSSRRLGHGFAKRGIYIIIFLSLTALVGNITMMTPDTHWIETGLACIPITLILGFTLTELKSIIENIGGNQDPVSIAIVKIIDGLFALFFGRVDYIINFLKNREPQP